MSSEAVAWAFKVNLKPSALKFTLVAMCECANYKTGRIFSSLAHLQEITSQDRKTLIANIAKLEELGWIADTGERTGKTGQIKVYRPVCERSPELEQFQKRNSSEIPVKQSQKRDTEPVKEPVSNKPKGLSDVQAIELVETWNEIAAANGLPTVRVLSRDRAIKVRKRIAEHGLDEMKEAIGRLALSDFLAGRKNDYRASFDFILQPKTLIRLMEGAYDNKEEWKAA